MGSQDLREVGNREDNAITLLGKERGCQLLEEQDLSDGKHEVEQLERKIEKTVQRNVRICHNRIQKINIYILFQKALDVCCSMRPAV